MLRKVVDSVLPKRVGFLQFQEEKSIYTIAAYNELRRLT
jgi:hypothetical protein